MKIKTITCHEVYNHGASLQEYALVYYLTHLGHEVETIHYKPIYLSGHFNLWAVSNPRFDKLFIRQLYLLVKLPKRLIDLKRKKAFDDFHARYIPTGKVKYTSNEDLKKNIPKADAFICGSDQIWNSFFQNGKDPAFYLNFVPDNKKKIAYAASFAIDELEEALKPLVQENVSRLNAVGVRETSGVRILNEIGISNAVQVLDPVFLIDRKNWKEKFVCPMNENFVFVYDFDGNPLIKQIAQLLKKEKGYKIFTVNSNIDYADKNFYLEGPETFLSLVFHSQFNITNSFHAVAFSLIFNKQFVVINRMDKINTRMRDLLGLFGLTDYLIADFKTFEQWDEINFDRVNKEIETKIQFSKVFLMNALND
jgi:hypothetical protein